MKKKEYYVMKKTQWHIQSEKFTEEFNSYVDSQLVKLSNDNFNLSELV